MLAIAIFTARIDPLRASPTRSASLVVARIVQGIGGAMMVPVGRLVILRSVPKHELVGSLAWLTIPALIGPVIGPPVGGFITTYFDWRWIFWINVPVGILGLVLASIFIPDLRGDTPRAVRQRRVPALRLRPRRLHDGLDVARPRPPAASA